MKRPGTVSSGAGLVRPKGYFLPPFLVGFGAGFGLAAMRQSPVVAASAGCTVSLSCQQKIMA